jgi:hypothetical protein
LKSTRARVKMNKLVPATGRLVRARNVVMRNYAVSTEKTDDYLKIIDMKKDFSKLSASQKMYMKRWDEANAVRHAEVMRKKLIARVSGITCLAIAISVYFYTMYAVKQEVFLDDFDLPEPPNSSSDAKA